MPYLADLSRKEAYGEVKQGISGNIYAALYTFAGTRTDPRRNFCLVSNMGSCSDHTEESCVLDFAVAIVLASQAELETVPLACSAGASLVFITHPQFERTRQGFVTPNVANGDLCYLWSSAWEVVVPNAVHCTFDIMAASTTSMVSWENQLKPDHQ